MKNTNGNKLFSTLLFFLTFFIAVFVIIAQKGESPVQREFLIGEPAPRTVFSPLQVIFVDEDETARQRQEKESALVPVYTIDSKVKRVISSRMREALKELSSARESLLSPEVQEKVFKALTLVFERFLNEGILDDAQKKELVDLGRLRIHRFNPETKVEGEREVKDLVSVSEAKEKASLFLEKEGVKERELRDAALEIFTRVIQPNLFFDETQTKERIKQAMDSVVPVTEEVKRGEMVIQKGLWSHSESNND